MPLALALALVAGTYGGLIGDPAPRPAPTPAPAPFPARPVPDSYQARRPDPSPMVCGNDPCTCGPRCPCRDCACQRTTRPAPAPPAPAPPAVFEPADAVAAMNRERARCGSPELKRDARLDRVAAGRLAQLADNGYSHALRDGSDPRPALCGQYGFNGPTTEGLVIGGSEPAGLSIPEEAAREPRFVPPPRTHHADLIDPRWGLVGFACGRSGPVTCSVTVYGGAAVAAAPPPAPAPRPVPAPTIAPALTYYPQPSAVPVPYQPVYAPQPRPFFYQPPSYGFGGGCAGGSCGGGRPGLFGGGFR